MTHFPQRSNLQRSILILLTTTALGVTPALAKTHAHHHAKKPAASHADQAERTTYTVKKGDTLALIADKLDTTVEALVKDNKLKKNSVLRPGQVLKGPVVAKASGTKATSGGSSKAAAKTYKVVRGDTLYSISQRQHVSVADLRAANGLSAKAQIHAGQELRLSGGEETAEELPSKAKSGKGANKGRLSPAEAEEVAVSEHAAAGRVVTVEGKGASYKARKGDSLAKIAGKLDTDVAEVKRLNHVKGTAVRAGQVYHGPGVAQHVYTAASGDTLVSIAERFGVSVERLRARNHLSKKVHTVRPGQKIYLPEGYHDRSAPTEEPRPSRSYPQPSRSYPPPSGRETLPSHPLPYVPPGGIQRPYVPPSATPEAVAGPTDAQISQMGKGRFQWPIRGEIISDFGPKPGGQRNDGINIQAAAGAVVRAAADGDVVYSGDQVPGFGNLVLIKHADGWVTAYAFLSHIDVKMQQKVTQGQQVGQAGNTGGVPEPQLHFEVRYAPNPQDSRARPVDPKLVLPK